MNIETQIQILRGLKSHLPTLKDGELGYAIDTNELFIGDPNDGNILVNKNDIEIRNDIVRLSTQLETIAKVSDIQLQDDINNFSVVYIDKIINLSGEITIPSNRKIVFRKDGKLIASINGLENVLKINGSNVIIENPIIEYSVTSPSPHAGYGNAICIGDYQNINEVNHSNIVIENPKITKNDEQHSVIAIFNSCNGIAINNPTILNGALGILMHWGGVFDESQPHTSPASVSYHPHDIKIKNYKYTGKGKPIHFASCYNVELNGLIATNSSTCVEVGVGDYANAIATPRQRPLVCKQLKIKNVYGYNIKGNAISVAGKGRRGGIGPDYILPKYDLEIENIVCEKGSDTGNGAVIVVCNNLTRGVKISNVDGIGYMSSSHIFLQKCSDIKLKNCSFTENNHNITILDVDNIDIDNCELNANTNPINFSSINNEKCENIRIKNSTFNKGNNSIYIFNGKDIKVENCTFNDYKSNVIKLGGENKNLKVSGCTFNKGTTPNISSHIELGLLEVAHIYDNVFNLGDTKFNINILTSAFKCNIHDNVSYGSSNTSNPMMIYQGTRTDKSNTIYNNETLNNFNVGTFTNYYSYERVEK